MGLDIVQNVSSNENIPMEESIVRKHGISGGTLKLIAIITMAIDHIGATLFPSMILFRIIGRIAFPIFCFLLVEGFVHTRSRKKYAIRLGAFALLSEVPFDLAFSNVLIDQYSQNVFFTLLIGFLLLMFFERYKEKEGLCVIAAIIAIYLADLLRTDYGGSGIILIVFLYLTRNKLPRVCGSVFLFANIIMGSLESFAIFSLIPISFYNGKKGIGIKYLFYLFYPTHLLLLYYLANYVLGITT